MLSKQPKLSGLPADVMLMILALCCVADVLRVEMTCRVLRDVVATRHLWLALLRGLPNDCAPNLPPHVSIESLDFISLKSLVVRAVRGSRNWNSPSPKVTREIKFTANNPRREPLVVVNKASFVPGGDYLMVQWKANRTSDWIHTYVQLLAVSNGENIWLYPNPAHSDSLSRKLWGCGIDHISENVLRVATAETNPYRYEKSFVFL
ncbi:hypothetical protein DFH11DRAFT_1632642 [Phellopilus nigrolimitatus]|nr:hypothetical protein DFH11DRAFT_1632642 [Phellopilus nigrolimitatus]